jgi:multicomponent Na+:H+ antiporter subunit G
MNDLIVSALVWLGSLLMLISALGVVRFPDLFTRMHAATKTGTVGIILLVSAVAVHFQALEITIFAVLIVAFFFLTAPIAGQLIGRAAYRSGVPLWDRTVCDEYGQRPEAGPPKP